ncbi:hypothetical protein EMIHUDRAFT_124914 [Emiliania huxleyi CCMP1516]|uniref:Uncharacterized protein n=3 Tax=Emiliania huxleyi TaxID=2903 RepID=A0A0D3ICD3_EMIH1|nr:hypothetical protein EMIHUDRAFT_124914 [Emiliania huxleyi CCMP1516]EOD08918.1 hypothetical protein EMIHUDRAFT_124914 [Emiliania huxleyi CCMP1516]|eukprot:XP_005761347.1 hypothetical protein EMIHUDRAFT_124914 [Emiliania huxleyi CCMP1516]
MQAAVPAGLSAGDAFVAQLPDGQQIQMTVPPGATAGQQIRVVAPEPVQAYPVVTAEPVVRPVQAVPGYQSHQVAPMPGYLAHDVHVIPPASVVPQPRPTAEYEGPRGGCCEPGGCCGPPTPPTQDIGPDGHVSILRVKYTDADCCSHSLPFKAEFMNACPPQLRQAGVTDGEWAHWAGRLYKEVNLIKPQKCSFICWASLVVMLATLCLIAPLCCAEHRKTIMAWDAAFRSWQAEFNAQVLQPKGIFCKSQSLCWVTRGPKGEKQRHYHRWIAFAFSADAVGNLMHQPHLMGDIESGCCGGPNEFECCMHP